MSTDTEPKPREVRFEGNFIDSADLLDKGVVNLEIASVTDPGKDRDKTGRVIDKYIIGFKGTPKRFIVNNNSLVVIAAQLGKKVDDWTGKKIGLQTRWIKEAFGEWNVPVVRVHASDVSQMKFATRKHYGQERPYTESEIADAKNKRRR